MILFDCCTLSSLHVQVHSHSSDTTLPHRRETWTTAATGFAPAFEELIPASVRTTDKFSVPIPSWFGHIDSCAFEPHPKSRRRGCCTTRGSTGSELERVCIDNELVITTWSAIHLRTKLQELYWKDGKTTASAMAFWEDTLRYLYLPRLKTRDSLFNAIRTGAASRDFFGTAYGQIRRQV
jgi:hypothetical protein